MDLLCRPDTKVQGTSMRARCTRMAGPGIPIGCADLAGLVGSSGKHASQLERACSWEARKGTVGVDIPKDSPQAHDKLTSWMKEKPAITQKPSWMTRGRVAEHGQARPAAGN